MHIIVIYATPTVATQFTYGDFLLRYNAARIFAAHSNRGHIAVLNRLKSIFCNLILISTKNIALTSGSKVVMKNLIAKKIEKIC